MAKWIRKRTKRNGIPENESILTTLAERQFTFFMELILFTHFEDDIFSSFFFFCISQWVRVVREKRKQNSSSTMNWSTYIVRNLCWKGTESYLFYWLLISENKNKWLIQGKGENSISSGKSIIILRLDNYYSCHGLLIR